MDIKNPGHSQTYISSCLKCVFYHEGL